MRLPDLALSAASLIDAHSTIRYLVAMEIYFLRHAEAMKSVGSNDAERPLSEAGVAQMEKEASSIARLGLRPDLVISSPLVRARQTAEIVARTLRLREATRVDDRLAPGFGPEELALILREHGTCAALMLVGHEPDFSRTISACTGGGRVECQKGSLARVGFERLPVMEGVLAMLLPPEVLSPTPF
jgi:phosphohistidine phosphatase